MHRDENDDVSFTLRQADERWQGGSRLVALALLWAAISYSLYPHVTFAFSSPSLLKLCVLTLASLEHGRLVEEGQAKFTDKGQFALSGGVAGEAGGRRSLEKEEEKLETRDLSPCFNMMKYPKTSVTDPA